MSTLPFYEPWLRIDQYQGDVFLDVGANVGRWAFNLAPRFERVLCVEPQPDPAARLLLWRQQHQIPNVELLTVAVSSSSISQVCVPLNIYSQDSQQCSVLLRNDVGPHGGVFLAPTLPLDQIVYDCFNVKLTEESFIKIDVEGMEVECLRGADRVLAANPQLLVEIHSEQNGETVKELLKQSGYKIHTILHPAYKNEQQLRTHYWIEARP